MKKKIIQLKKATRFNKEWEIKKPEITTIIFKIIKKSYKKQINFF
jgi:hypothetical protein